MRFLIAHRGNLQNVKVLEKMPEFGFCDVVKNPDDCITLFYNNAYDCVIISNAFGNEDAFEMCDEVRLDSKRLLIAYVTTNPNPEEKILFLNSGFDLYVSADTTIEELSAELMVFLRRDNDSPYKSYVHFKGFCLRPECRMLYYGDKPVCLRKKEYELVEYLAINIGKIITKDLLLDHSWRRSVDDTSNTLDVHIRTLRVKLGQYTSEKVIETKRGYGYVLFP